MVHLTIWLNRIVKGLLLLLPGFFPGILQAQSNDNIRLEEAYDLAQQNYPLIKQKGLIKQTSEINMENLERGFWPQISINGQASFQSEVTDLQLPIPGYKFTLLPKDQYQLLADVNQTILDGSLTKHQKSMQELNAKVEDQKINVELYKLKERINQLFLGVLYLDEQLKLVDLVEDGLQAGIRQVEAQVQHGTAFRSNLNVLKAEMLKTEQRTIELKASRKGLLQTLGLYLNRQLGENTVLEQPAVPDIKINDEITRPELQLYADQAAMLEHQNKVIDAGNTPKTSLFFQGGYGRPGFNFLRSNFDWYYMTGIRLNWRLGGFYTTKKERQLIELDKKMLDAQKETFLLNTNTQLRQLQSEIEKYTQLIATDDSIIVLRASVKEAAKAQLNNSVITSNDYVREVNAEDEARQTRVTHQLQLLQARINYQTILGKQ